MVDAELDSILIPFSNLFLSYLISYSRSIGAIADHLIGIITEQIACKLRRECSLWNEYCVTTWLYVVGGSYAFLSGVRRVTVSLVVMNEVIDSLFSMNRKMDRRCIRWKNLGRKWLN